VGKDAFKCYYEKPQDSRWDLERQQEKELERVLTEQEAAASHYNQTVRNMVSLGLWSALRLGLSLGFPT
jgi:hypothetical protein